MRPGAALGYVVLALVLAGLLLDPRREMRFW
jgi:hypothetical protein